MNWHAGHRYGQFMVKAWGKRVHEHEQYRNRHMVKAWCKIVQPHGLDEGMVNSWSRHGVKGYTGMNCHAGHCHGQFMVKACGKRVHEHEQYRNRRKAKAWCKMVQRHGWDEGMVNSWDKMVQPRGWDESMVNSWSRHGVKWYRCGRGDREASGKLDGDPGHSAVIECPDPFIEPNKLIF